jgi:hypothetical protein
MSRNPFEGLFGKWRIQVDGKGLKGILRNFDLQWKFLHPIPFIPLDSTDSQTSPEGVVARVIGVSLGMCI